MKRITLFEAIILAAVFSAASWVLWPVLLALVFWPMATQSAITILALAYIAYLLIRSERKAGKLVTSMLVTGIVLATFAFGTTFGFTLLIYTALIWFVRSVFFHRSLVGVFCDGLISVFAVGCGLMLFGLGSHLAAGVWGFFLCQALFVFVPGKAEKSSRMEDCEPQSAFLRAHANAETVIRSLSVRISQ